MINEDKVKLMMKLATYEQSEGKEDQKVMEFFKGDFISFNTFMMLLGVSVALVLFFVADLGGKFFDNMQTFIEYDFVGQGMEYLTIWIVFMVVYGIISSIVYRSRYKDTKKRLDIYQKNLRDLRKMK